MTNDEIAQLRALYVELLDVGNACTDGPVRTLIVGAASALIAQSDALDEARAERDAAMALLRECDEVATSLCGVADLVEHGDLFARIDAMLSNDKGA